MQAAEDLAALMQRPKMQAAEECSGGWGSNAAVLAHPVPTLLAILSALFASLLQSASAAMKSME